VAIKTVETIGDADVVVWTGAGEMLAGATLLVEG
jgi:hypothetical protein